MNKKVSGKKPRPRVAVIGKFDEETIEEYKKIFPTVWEAENLVGLAPLVDIQEIDLIILGKEIKEFQWWAENCHVICFSQNIDYLPGPMEKSGITIKGISTPSEYLLPDISLAMDRQRKADLITVEDIRGWWRIVPIGKYLGSWDEIKTGVDWKGWDIFRNGALLIENLTQTVLAVEYIREKINLGVAYLPNEKFDRFGWVSVIVSKWAEIDKESFPNFGAWTSSNKWMLEDEEQIINNISALEEKKIEVIDDIDKKIGNEQKKLAKRKAEIDMGRRRLITAQGDELLEETKNVLETIGFEVESMDAEIEEDQPKVEDLRIRDPDNKDWEGIVEVRGYARSAGRTRDFQRIGRFAELYHSEKKRPPDKRIYIINGEIELPPDQRQEPLSSAMEDVNQFAKSNGLVIWTLDLFHAIKTKDEDKYESMKKSIKSSVGRWILNP